MAGSYKHCVDDDGQLYVNEHLVRMLENGGDVFEAVEEMYGMIWWLAYSASNGALDPDQAAKYLVETARDNYKMGLSLSPGTEGRLVDDE